MDQPQSPHRRRTRLVHAGHDTDTSRGFVNVPAFRGSTVLYPDAASLKSPKQRYTYGTHGTPTTDALADAWSELAGAAGTAMVPSGLAAIAMALQTALKSGDHLLMTDAAYFPARRFAEQVLRPLGVETTYYDPAIGAGVAELIRDNTRAILTEAPGSQSLEMQDIPAIASGRPCARRLRHHGQYLGDAAVFSAARARRRSRHRSRHQISLRPFRSAARPRFGQCRVVAAAEGLRRPLRHSAGTGRLLSRAARSAHDGAQAQGGRASGAGAGALAGDAAGGQARHPSRAAALSRPRDLEARLLRLVGPVQHRVASRPGGGGRGDARRPAVVRPRLQLGRLRKPHHSVRLLDLPHRDEMGAGRSDDAIAGRARRHRGSEGRSRAGFRAD